MLGRCLFHGEGVEKDFVEAFKWLTLAVERMPEARAELAELNLEISPTQMVDGIKKVSEYRETVSEQKQKDDGVK